MKKIKFFLFWQDMNEETWLDEQSGKGYCLDAVRFPFSYSFRPDTNKKFEYHLNSPKESGAKQAEFIQLFQSEGWDHIGRKNGWHYFRREIKTNPQPIPDWAAQAKADKYQRMMMGLVGLLPILLIVFPAFGRRFNPPLYDLLRFGYFIALALYTLATYKVYRRVNQLREM